MGSFQSLQQEETPSTNSREVLKTRKKNIQAYHYSQPKKKGDIFFDEDLAAHYQENDVSN